MPLGGARLQLGNGGIAANRRRSRSPSRMALIVEIFLTIFHRPASHAMERLAKRGWPNFAAVIARKVDAANWPFAVRDFRTIPSAARLVTTAPSRPPYGR